MVEKRGVKPGDEVTCLVTEYDFIKGCIYIVKHVDKDGKVWTIDNAGDMFFLNPGEYEPVPVAGSTSKPAPLKIEAGKYYRTRDGLKVGPMKRFYGGVWREEGGSGMLWRSDGERYFYLDHSDYIDLVAEWVDEQKAGNDSSPADDAPQGCIRIGNTWISLLHGGIVMEAPKLYALSTPAIVALIEDGAAKPAARPKVHADKASATKVAERLALRFPGQKFGVFVLADSKIADTVTETVTRTVLRAA
ncbi:hypothetical protein [Limoniibacter endophyticus]|uniref:Uncharacterized protein n=1 Tax=Limoniibacter endophyticus TaxID=1565040 RepID=A0A8J3GFY6_9HYPH|nr:hypothetical protein [Limoniibacter endophyticus]GHC61328.1 hypothetical protein GCM10010136_01810 [Limoniibacter endophyticus]